ncbi:MAG: hypothetical protein KA802_09260 [Saprospiraceae bacterium]|nr:hypothetical protein [Saprospiraceae bacterium]
MRGSKAKFIRRMIESTFANNVKVDYTDKLHKVVQIPLGFKKDEAGKFELGDNGLPVVDVFESQRITRSLTNNTQRYFYQEAKKKAKKI